MLEIKVNKDISLRMMTRHHAKELFALTDKNRKFLRKFLPWTDATLEVKDSLDHILKVEKEYKLGESLDTAIFYKNELIGRVGFHTINYDNLSAEIGYWLSEEYTGSGIMTDCCKALIKYGFEKLGLNRVEIRVLKRNKKSAAIPRRLKFKEEGIFRQKVLMNGVFYDEILFSYLRQEFERRTKKNKTK
jgi:ribosomal-protein-serine acetyltransferase